MSDRQVSEAGKSNVSKKYPEYLKLHVEEQESKLDERLTPNEFHGLAKLCEAFESSTGWSLNYHPADSRRQSIAVGHDSQPSEEATIALAPSHGVSDALPWERVEPLAHAIGTLVGELTRAQGAVWEREAELAAGIPVTLRPEDQRTLAHRLEAVLQGGAEAIGCQAAALYLLDDATSYLKLRSAWRLPKSRFWDEPRPLRGSAADLEALVGHAVALEDTSLLPHWKVPEEEFAAALCLPVSTNSTPLGTLWFFADSVRDFTPEQINMSEIVAGRLVADLEREVLKREGLRQRQSDVAHQTLVNWQDELRPRVPPLVDGWQVAGCSSHCDAVAGHFFDWCILPDGRIAVSLGQAEGPPIEAGLTVTTLQIALRSHATHAHEARQMLDRLNESLWTHSTGDRFASLFYVIIDPDTGESQFSSAGEIHGLICGADQLEVFSDGNPSLGFDPDCLFRETKCVVQAGQSLVIFNRGRMTAIDEEVSEPEECRVAEVVQKRETATAEELSRAVAEELDNVSAQDRAVVVVRRLF